MANSGPNGEWFATTPEFWALLEPIIAFKIWYAAGTVFGGAPADWYLAPATGVQVLMVYHARGIRTVVAGRDEYTMPGQKGSKLGLEINLATYKRIYRTAMADTWRP